MAEKRMISKRIIESDLFIDMPLSSQALYFHLIMRADDDGFVGSPKSVRRMVGASDDDLNLLIAKGFVFVFGSGVLVLNHWNIHNTIKKDRYHPTLYRTEFESLTLNEIKEYELIQLQELKAIDCNVYQEQEPEPEPPEKPKKEKPKRHKYGEYDNVLLSDTDMQKLQTEFPNDWQQRIERLSEYMASTGKTYKNHLATIRNWARNDAERVQKRQEQEPPPYYCGEAPEGFYDCDM